MNRRIFFGDAIVPGENYAKANYAERRVHIPKFQSNTLI